MLVNRTHVVQEDFYSCLNNLSFTVNYNPSLKNKVFHEIIAPYISSLAKRFERDPYKQPLFSKLRMLPCL
jgi:hypothetical protein